MIRIDWPKVLEDLAWLYGEPDTSNPPARIPVSPQKLADQLDVPRGTLRGWMDGAEPKHADGEALLERWCKLSGKARGFAPLTKSLGRYASRALG